MLREELNLNAMNCTGVRSTCLPLLPELCPGGRCLHVLGTLGVDTKSQSADPEP